MAKKLDGDWRRLADIARIPVRISIEVSLCIDVKTTAESQFFRTSKGNENMVRNIGETIFWFELLPGTSEVRKNEYWEIKINSICSYSCVDVLKINILTS